MIIDAKKRTRDFPKFSIMRENDREIIDNTVAEIIDTYSGNEDDIQMLVIDAVNSIGKADVLIDDYKGKNKNFFLREFNRLTGKSAASTAKIFQDVNAGQYAVLRLIQQVNEQNLMSLQKTTEVSKRVSELQRECDEEFEDVYGLIENILIKYSDKINSLDRDSKEHNIKISELERKFKKLKGSVMMNCPECSAPIKSGEFLCPECGETISEMFPDFTQEQNLRQLEEHAEKLRQIITRENDLSKYVWNKTVQKYADAMIKVQNIIDEEFLDGGITTQLKDSIKSFIDRCGNAEFQIALIGAVKAGKSTLMNAIAGCEAASTRVTPETAALTKFRASSDDKNHVNVKFYSDKKWSELWNSVTKDPGTQKRASVFFKEYKELNAESQKSIWVDHEPIKAVFTDFDEFKNEIEKWTSSRSPVHYFVEEVEICLADFNMPPEVVFVDTPGLDDPVEYRSKITGKYLKFADAIVVCIKADAIKGSDLHTIYDVFQYAGDVPQKIFICATQCDRLNSPEKEWDELKDKWIDHLVQEMYFGRTELAEKNIIPTSAFFYNLINKYENIDNLPLENEDMRTIMSIGLRYGANPMQCNQPDVREKLKKKTNIDTIKLRLNTDIIEKRKELLEKEISASYKVCRNALETAVSGIIKTQRNDIDRISKNVNELIQEKQENQKKIEQFTKEKEETASEMKKLISKTKNYMRSLIDDINKLQISEDE